MFMKSFHDFNRLADVHGCKVGGWFELTLHAAGNGSPNVRRSNTSQEVYTGHVQRATIKHECFPVVISHWA